MSTHKTVTRAAVIMVAAISLSRVLGLIRDMVISGLFGQGRNTDIYYAAFRLPDLLFYLIAGGVLSAAFVPVFVEYLSKGEREQAWELFSVIASVMAVFVSVFILIGEIFARQLVPIVATPGIRDPVALDNLAYLTRIILPAQFFFFMGGLMMASLWAHQHFTAPGLGPSIYNICIIIGGAIAGTQFGPDAVQGLAWGALAGAFVGNFVLQFLVLRHYGLSYKPNFNFRHPGAVKVWKLMVPVIFSLSLTYVNVYINSWFASFLFPGAISALDRANRLMQVPIGIFGQAIGIGFYTTLAAQFATNKMEEFRETVNYGMRVVAFAAIPSSVMLIVLRVPIIQLLFQHGHFNAQNTIDVADPLIFYAIGILPWSAHPLIARAFYSMRNTWIPMVTGTVITIIFIVLNYVLMKGMQHTQFRGHSGLALATTISAAGNAAVLIFLLQRKLNGLNGRRIAISFIKITIASAVMGAAAWATLRITENLLRVGLPLKIQAGIQFAIPTLVGGVFFVIMVKQLRMEEAAAVWNIIVRKFSRRAPNGINNAS